MYSILRYRLMPYIYTTAREAYDTGLPLTRPLMLAFESDPACCFNQYPLEYMFGQAFLVCPVCTGQASQTVYLPAGWDWLDFWTGARVSGGQSITVPVQDLRRLPLFVRAASIIPLQPASLYLEPAWEQLELQLWGEGRASYRLYEDDGVSLDYQANGYSFTTICSEVTETELSLDILPRDGSFKTAAAWRSLRISWPGLTGAVSLAPDSTPLADLTYAYAPDLTVTLTASCSARLKLHFYRGPAVYASVRTGAAATDRLQD